jgi:hypothetical protein
MEIIQPRTDKKLYIVEDLLSPDEAKMCSDFAHAKLFYSGKVTNEERSALGWVPDQSIMDNAEEVDAVVIKAIDIMKSLMKEHFPEQEVELFKTYEDISVRTPEGGKLDGKATPHVDGPGEFVDKGVNIRTVGGLLYFNDNYDGGELTYPNLNYEYKPKAGSFVMHMGMHDDYLHGVNEVKNGWRFNFGIFGYERYPEFDTSVHYGSQGEDRFK